MARNREKREEALRKSEERLQLVVRATNGLLWDFDFVTGALWWSPGYYEKLGIQEGTPVTRDLWLSMVHPDDAPRVLANTEEMASKAQAEKWALEYRLRQANGSYADMHDRGYFIRDAEGKPLRAVGAVTDITERKRIEEELRRGKEQLQSILDKTPSVVNVKDLEGRYIFVNHWYEVFAGVPADQIIGKTSHDLFPEHVANEHQAHNDMVITANKPVEFEQELPLTDGMRTHLVNKFPLHDGEGKPYAVCTIATDITARKKYERHLQEHARDQTQLLYELLQAQEAEQRRLATDIHDGPLQSLGVSLLTVDRLSRRHERGETAAAQQELQLLRSNLAEIVSEVRGVLEDLSLDVLTTYGLGMALAGHLDRFSAATGVAVDLRNSVGYRLPANLELLLYRLAQEGLANVRKHAYAINASVCLETLGGLLYLTVADDGCGFDIEAMERTQAGDSGDGRLGLRSMRQQIESPCSYWLLAGKPAPQAPTVIRTRGTFLRPYPLSPRPMLLQQGRPFSRPWPHIPLDQRSHLLRQAHLS